MTEKLMVDRACFERGCACLDNFNVQKVPDDAVWVKKEKEWVGLTDEQIEEIWGNTPMMLNSHNNRTRISFAKAIDAKLKEKNT